MLLSGIPIEVVRKDIRNLRLSVHPPAGRIRIAAPRHLSDATIRAFALRKLDWIRKQQTRLARQERETPREFRDGEGHHVWGRRLPLRVVEAAAASRLELSPRRLTLHVRPGTSVAARARIVEVWYRAQIRAALPALLSTWEPLMGVHARQVSVRRMRTRWGSCTPRTASIRLNTDLARKPPECLEYVLVHELAHLVEPTHNARFHAVMDRFLPSWRSVRRMLSRPVEAAPAK